MSLQVKWKTPPFPSFSTEGYSHSKAKQVYQKRRFELRQRLTYPTVIFSVDQRPGYPNSWVHIPDFGYQDPLFLFLTGLLQFPAALYLSPTEEILFLPKVDPKKTFWEGKTLGVGSTKDVRKAQKTTGFQTILPLEGLTHFLNKNNPKDLGLFWHESQSAVRINDSHETQNKKLVDGLSNTPTLHNVAAKSWELKLPFDTHDLSLLRAANQIAFRAFEHALAMLPHVQTEFALSAQLNQKIHQETPFGNSFPTIMAAGPNATVLHYTQNTGPLTPGDLLLIDFGAQYYTQHSDVSRTIPINGKFDPMQAILYQIVLDTQIAVEKKVKPGITLSELDIFAWTTLNTFLKTRFLSIGGRAELPYKTQPHGIGHFLGRQVHDGDPFRDYKSQPLKPNTVITNEPGLYGHFTLTLNGKKYAQTLGIRIEDDLLITPKGCKNLTLCPKTILEIEHSLQLRLGTGVSLRL